MALTEPGGLLGDNVLSHLLSVMEEEEKGHLEPACSFITGKVSGFNKHTILLDKVVIL